MLPVGSHEPLPATGVVIIYWGLMFKKGFLAIRGKRFILLSLLSCLIVPGFKGQSVSNENVQENSDQLLALEGLSLLSDLRTLNEQTSNLAPLSHALAKAEIADAAWLLDREWARALLIKAYELTFPDEDERDRLRNKSRGSRPTLPLSMDRARRSVRNRVMQIAAAREKQFADQLFRSGLEELGSSETYMMYANLAENARQHNDMDSAGQYLMQAADLDPSQIAVGFTIADIANTDRARADKLIVQYLDRLRHFPLSRANGGVIRVFLVVNKLIFPPAGTAPPGPAVMSAYVSYTIQSLGDLETREPGSLAGYRSTLLRAWLPLRQYAPNLAADFMTLEQRSRGSNEAASLPTVENQSKNGKDGYENQIRESTESDHPNEIIVASAISRGDFTKARKLIDKLSDGPEKKQLTEMINAKEALYFLKKDELLEAKRLAEKLERASTIREVYPALIRKCVRDQDQICATSLMLQAMKQLKASDTTPWKPPADIPTSIVASSGEFDPILDGMAKLTLAVFPISDEIALIGLGETVVAANVSQLDTSQGRVGLDATIFKKLAPKNELRVRQEAESFKDPLRRLVSLAAIYQWKVEDLDKRSTKARAQRKDNPGK